MEEQNSLRRVWSDDISEIPANSQLVGAEEHLLPLPAGAQGSCL